MTEREKFEIACASAGLAHISLLFNGEKYVDNVIDNMWWSWQAAKAQADPESVAPKESMTHVKDDDFVLVPRGILGAACSAIDKKRDAPVLLSKLRELSMSVGAMRAVPEGWKLVPVEPTTQMARTAKVKAKVKYLSLDGYKCIYKAMLEAAPDGDK